MTVRSRFYSILFYIRSQHIAAQFDYPLRYANFLVVFSLSTPEQSEDRKTENTGIRDGHEVVY